MLNDSLLNKDLAGHLSLAGSQPELGRVHTPTSAPGCEGLDPARQLKEVDSWLREVESWVLEGGYDACRCLDGVALIWRSLKRKRDRRAYGLRERLVRLIHRLYEDNELSLEALQRRCGLSPAYVSRRFSELGLKARHCSKKTPDAAGPYRVYSVDHGALDDLHDPSVAYLLGFLWADGHVLLRNNGAPEGLRVALNPKDRGMLVLIGKILGSDAPIRPVTSRLNNGRSYQSLSLTIYSRRLAAELVALGYADRDQGRGAVAPPTVPQAVEGDFWRGVCDGDGHIRRDQRYVFPLSGWELGICGTRALVAAFESFVSRRLGLSTALVRNGRSAVNYRVYVNGVRTPILAEALYPKGCLALERKYKLARDLTEARRTALANGVREKQTGTRLIYTNTRDAEPVLRQILGRRLRHH